MLFRRFAILFLIFPFCSLALAQFRSDFQVSESGLYPYFDIDGHSRIHIVWEKQLENDHATYYAILDSNGNSLFNERRISSNPATLQPSISINKDLVACTWEDHISLTADFFSYYIKVKILKDGQDYSSEFHVDDGDILMIDAYRHKPIIIWQNDSTLFSVWHGDGSRTNSVHSQSDVYMKKLLLPLPLRRAFVIDTVINNAAVNVKELCPKVIKKKTEAGFLTVWLEKDESASWNIAGVQCDDSLRPVSEKVMFVQFGALQNDFMAPPFVIQKNNGNLLIGWAKDTTNYDANIYFQEFTEQGIAVSGINKVNDTLAYATCRVSADMDADGNFIVVWDSYGVDIFAQRYSNDMVKIGSNFRVNTLQTGYNCYPYVKLKNKRLYTIWRKSLSGSPSVWMNILDFNNPSALRQAENPAPVNFNLHQAYPNPFNPRTTITFDLPEAAQVKIVVYDLMGHTIWQSTKTNYSAGTYSVIWNGVNNSGQAVSAGVYLVRLISNKYNATQKVLLIK